MVTVGLAPIEVDSTAVGTQPRPSASESVRYDDTWLVDLDIGGQTPLSEDEAVEIARRTAEAAGRDLGEYDLPSLPEDR